jgi:signal transduction protein with GAF and PtsI domain
VISNREDARHELQRLQRALDALTADIEAIERRPRLSFRQHEEFRKIESAIGHFAFAVKSGNART